MKIALITYDGTNYSDSENEDLELARFLEGKGLSVSMITWSDPGIDWSAFDLAILKSPWDYHEKLEEFRKWLTKVEKQGLRLLNPIDIVRWNMDKHYLSDISAASLPVLQTAFIEKDSRFNLEGYFNHFQTHTIIVKPAVSGGSKNTFKIKKDEVPTYASKIASLVKQEAFIVQPFIEEIQTEGEWSFIFFNEKFSHAILKKTKKDEFRVQERFGGTVHPQTPTAELLYQAEQYVKQFASACLYCRVDGVRIKGQFQLMELELIEPSLFLSADPNSFERYYEALTEKINSYNTV